MRKIAKPNAETLDYVACFKCQWEAIENPYTVVFGQANSHATEYAIYNENGHAEYVTSHTGTPAWRVMFRVRFDSLPAPVQADVRKRYREVWHLAST